jgi:hypothetical protein
MPTTLTRPELYELVWAEPISALAPRFGISGVAMKKVCAKAAIPVPSRGYWAKKQAGKQVERVPLPPRPPGMEVDIPIGRGRHYRPGTVLDPLAPVPAPPEFEESIEAVRLRIGLSIRKAPSVPNLASRAHPAISRVLVEDDRRREKARTALVAFDWDRPRWDSVVDRRRLRILNALFLAAGRLGARGWVRNGRDSMEFGLSVCQQEVRLRLQPVPRSTNGNRSHPRLRLAIARGYDGNSEHAHWEDEPDGRLESHLRAILVEVFVSAEERYREACVHQHAWQTEARQRRLLEAENRRAAAAEQEREREAAEWRERGSQLLDQAARLRQADEIRAYVERVRAEVGAADPAVEAWAAWAMKEADRMDPLPTREYSRGWTKG